MRLITAIIIGALLGFIGTHILFVGSALSLLPWAIAGLILGWFGHNKKESLINGAVYGFTLSFIFMVSGYNGSRPLINVVPFFILLGLFGAVCGGILGILGFFSRKLLRK